MAKSFLTCLPLLWAACLADYSIRFRMNSAIKKSYSSGIHFRNLDSTTFYDKISIKLESKIVGLCLNFRRNQGST